MLVLLVCGAQAAGTEEADSELRAVVASLRSKVAELCFYVFIAHLFSSVWMCICFLFFLCCPFAPGM